MRFLIVVTIIAAILGLLISLTNADAACTTYILQDGRIVTMCCSPDGTLCQIL